MKTVLLTENEFKKVCQVLNEGYIDDLKSHIRIELKKMGYNSRQVSVVEGRGGLSYSLHITIKDANIPIKPIENMAKKFEDVRWDESGMEILSGGNTYISVNYDYDVLDKAKEKYMDYSNEVFDALNDEKSVVVGEYDDGKELVVIKNGQKYNIYLKDFRSITCYSKEQFINQLAGVILHAIVNDGLKLID